MSKFVGPFALLKTPELVLYAKALSRSPCPWKLFNQAGVMAMRVQSLNLGDDPKVASARLGRLQAIVDDLLIYVSEFMCSAFGDLFQGAPARAATLYVGGLSDTIATLAGCSGKLLHHVGVVREGQQFVKAGGWCASRAHQSPESLKLTTGVLDAVTGIPDAAEQIRWLLSRVWVLYDTAITPPVAEDTAAVVGVAAAAAKSCAAVTSIHSHLDAAAARAKNAAVAACADVEVIRKQLKAAIAAEHEAHAAVWVANARKRVAVVHFGPPQRVRSDAEGRVGAESCVSKTGLQSETSYLASYAVQAHLGSVSAEVYAQRYADSKAPSRKRPVGRVQRRSSSKRVCVDARLLSWVAASAYKRYGRRRH
jgi:hypothetical protein